MILKSLELILAGNVPGIGRRWIDSIRAEPRLKALAALSDGELASVHAEILGKLARWFEKEADRNEIGSFFVILGKEYCAAGIPLSELSWALSLDRKAVTGFLTDEEDLEGAHRIYSLLEAVDRVADFFFLGSYYLSRGFLEETVFRMRQGDSISDELLAKYFRDDLFMRRR